MRIYGAVLIRVLWISVVLRRSCLAILISITRCRASLRSLVRVVLTCIILLFVARGNQLHNPVLRYFMAASLPAGGTLRRWRCKSLSSIRAAVSWRNPMGVFFHQTLSLHRRVFRSAERRFQIRLARFVVSMRDDLLTFHFKQTGIIRILPQSLAQIEIDQFILMCCQRRSGGSQVIASSCSLHSPGLVNA